MMPPLSGPKARRVAPEHPLDRDQGEDDEALHQRAQRVLLPHHAPVEQGEAGRGHQQHQRARHQDPRGVAACRSWAARALAGAAGAGPGAGAGAGRRRAGALGQGEASRGASASSKDVAISDQTFATHILLDRESGPSRAHQSALSSRSPVRMRTAVSTGVNEDLAVTDIAGLRRPGEDARHLVRRGCRAPRPRP